MWLDRYVMAPFKDGGRDFDGVDCFGMHMLLLAEEAGIKLPEVGVSYERDAKAVRACIEQQMICGDWIKIIEGNGIAAKGSARKFDLLVMSAHVRVGSAVIKSDLHIGTALGDGSMIHTERPAGAAVITMDDPDVRDRIKSVFRHRLQVQ